MTGGTREGQEVFSLVKFSQAWNFSSSEMESARRLKFHPFRGKNSKLKTETGGTSATYFLFTLREFWKLTQNSNILICSLGWSYFSCTNLNLPSTSLNHSFSQTPSYLKVRWTPLKTCSVRRWFPLLDDLLYPDWIKWMVIKIGLFPMAKRLRTR